jgi:hypothetical protein
MSTEIHAPPSGDIPAGMHEKDDFLWMDINEKGLEDLESWRKQFFLQPLSVLKGREFRRFS